MQVNMNDYPPLLLDKHLGKGTARLLLLFISVTKGLPILSRTHNLK